MKHLAMFSYNFHKPGIQHFGTKTIVDHDKRLHFFLFCYAHYFLLKTSQQFFSHVVEEAHTSNVLTEPRREKTGPRGFRPGPTRTGLYSHREELES